MGGFELSFFVPFDRLDIYAELVVNASDRLPLGASPNMVFTILRPGYDASDEMSPGCVRQVSFAAPFFGETISELTVAEPGAPGEDGRSELVWRQLHSSTRLNLLGDGRYLPEFGCVLESSTDGTLVTMRYNFARAEMSGPLCFLVGCMPQLLKWHLHASISSVWHMEMVRRGHVPLRKPTFGKIAADRSEEEQIRLKAQLPRGEGLHPCLRWLA